MKTITKNIQQRALREGDTVVDTKHVFGYNIYKRKLIQNSVGARVPFICVLCILYLI